VTFLSSGDSESFKGCWHLGGLIFAGGACCYNFAALAKRREAHLLVNGLVYAVLTVYEYQKTSHHFS
jgi:hypothetical protein